MRTVLLVLAGAVVRAWWRSRARRRAAFRADLEEWRSAARRLRLSKEKRSVGA